MVQSKTISQTFFILIILVIASLWRRLHHICFKGFSNICSSVRAASKSLVEVPLFMPLHMVACDNSATMNFV